MGFLARIYSEIGRQLKRLNLTRGQMMSIALIGAAVALFMIFLAVFGTQTDYVALSRTPASAADRAKVTEALQREGIEYVEEDGLIKVPRARLAQARASLVVGGEAVSGDFVQGIYYTDISTGNSLLSSGEQRVWQQQKALENELSRDLSAISGIRSTQVRVSRPKQTSRLVALPDASASVILKKTNPADKLPQATIDAIAGYVSRAVPNMPVGNVRITDADIGRIFRPKDDTDEMYLASDRREQERQFAEDIKRRLTERFEKIFPAFAGQIYIDVVAQLDLDHTNTKTVTYDETFSKILKTTETEEHEGAAPTAGPIETVPNATTRLAAGGIAGGSSSERIKTVDEKMDPGWTELVKRETPGKVEKIALSVVLPFDGVKVVAQRRVGGDAELAGPQLQTAVDEQMDEYRQMLTTAYGIYGAEAPRVDVTAVYTAMPELPPTIVLRWQDRLIGVLETRGGEIFLGIVTLLGFVVLWRTLKRGEDIPSYETELSREDEEEELPSLDELLPKAEVDVSRLRTMKMTDVIKESIHEDAGTAAQLIRRWMERER